MTDRSLTDPATLRRLAEAATPGPWGAGGSIYVADGVLDIASTRCDIAIPDKQARANAAYIAAANPQTILALLDRLAELEAIVAKVRGGVSARSNLCAAMAQWLGREHWSTVPDDHAVLESRGTEGEFRITAGMIREANR